MTERRAERRICPMLRVGTPNRGARGNCRRFIIPHNDESPGSHLVERGYSGIERAQSNCRIEAYYGILWPPRHHQREAKAVKGIRETWIEIDRGFQFRNRIVMHTAEKVDLAQNHVRYG